MRFILAAIAFLVSLGLFVAAFIHMGVAAANRDIRAEGTIGSSASYAVIPSEVLAANPGAQTITIRGDGMLTAAIGRTADVDGWVGDARRAVLALGPDRTLTAADAGAADDRTSPHGADLWIEERQGAGELTLDTELPPGYAILVASDSGAAISSASIDWPKGSRAPWSGPLLLGGALFLVAALALLLWALLHLRGRQAALSARGDGPIPVMADSPARRQAAARADAEDGLHIGAEPTDGLDLAPEAEAEAAGEDIGAPVLERESGAERAMPPEDVAERDADADADADAAFRAPREPDASPAAEDAAPRAHGSTSATVLGITPRAAATDDDADRAHAARDRTPEPGPGDAPESTSASASTSAAAAPGEVDRHQAEDRGRSQDEDQDRDGAGRDQDQGPDADRDRDDAAGPGTAVPAPAPADDESRWRRPRGRNRSSAPKRTFRLAAVLGVASLGLTGCAADMWPEALGGPDEHPTATATSSVEQALIEEGAPMPALTQDQLVRIIDDAVSVAERADAAGDAAALAARFGGLALAERTGIYAARAADPGVAAPAPFLGGSLDYVVPEATSSWPRTVFAIVQPEDAATLPEGVMLEQASARDPYRIMSLVELAPATALPSAPPATIGAGSLASVAPGLSLAPDSLAAAYGDLVQNGDASAHRDAFDVAADPLLPQIGDAYRRSQLQAIDQSASQIEFSNRPAQGSPLGVASSEGGAIVAVGLDEIEKLSAKTKLATIKVTGATAALAGTSTSSLGFEKIYTDQLLFYVPPAQSGQTIRLLGYSQALTSARQLAATEVNIA